jgi:hypothetical protein
MLKVDNHIPMQNFVPFSFYHRVVKAEKIVSLYFSESICINDADPHTQVHPHACTHMCQLHNKVGQGNVP